MSEYKLLTIDGLRHLLQKVAALFNTCVTKQKNETITGVKTFANGLSGNLTGNVTGNLTGNASSATRLSAYAHTSMPTGTLSADGMEIYGVYNDTGYPASYGNVVNVQGSQFKGAGQLMLGWSGETNGLEHLYYRNKRDNQSTWSDWRTLAFTTDSITGNAATATSLQNARTIGLSGAMTGSASFNGTANITIPALWRSCLVGQSSSTSTNPWYKFASFAVNAANDDIQAVFLVESTYSAHVFGFLRVHVRSNGDKTVTASNCTLAWAVHTGFALGNFVLVVPSGASPTVELWTKIDAAWRFYRFTVLSEGARASTGTRWTLYNASSAGQQASIPTAGTQKASTLAGAVNTAVSTTSDRRMKDSIGLIPDAVLDKWSNAEWSQFKFKNGEGLHFGLIAQDAEQALDEEYKVVSKNEDDGMMSINYIEALALEAAWQRRENKRLRKNIAILENRINAMEKK